jgi:hypothetical protein
LARKCKDEFPDLLTYHSPLADFFKDKTAP